MPVKPIRLVMIFVLAGSALFSRAQSVIIPSWVNMPADSVSKAQLISSLNGFLSQKEQPNKQNTFVLKEALPETSDLLDEMKGMDANAKLKDNNFYKCYLTNVVQLDSDDYLVQLSYIGLNENIPLLRASFRLLAKRVNGIFYFYSPLKQNTIAWRVKKYNNVTCHYKDTLNATDARAYQKKLEFYDKKLNIPVMPVEFYYCDNFIEVQQLLGIDYKADYNGAKYNNLSSHEGNTNLMVSGWNDSKHRFDAHDLWHERLHMVMDRSIINRPVDEGCAYLYGGSWGYSWAELLAKFKTYAAANPNADWLKLYTESVRFDDGEKPMYIAYLLNALIVQKIEREKGFAPVMQLLSCGPRQKDDDNYFAALEKIAGISKADFNTEMLALVRAEK